MKFHRFLERNPGWLPATIFALVLAALAAPAQAQTPSLTFTVETITADGRTITPKLTWATTPAAQSCTATGGVGWSGTKAASGTQTLAAINSTTSYSIACTWPGDTTTIMEWKIPTVHQDGTPLPQSEIGGFRMLWGRAADNLDQSALIPNNQATTWTSPNLAPGTWFFSVVCYKTNGLESNPSNIRSKTITAATSLNRTLEVAVRYPAPPTDVVVR